LIRGISLPCTVASSAKEFRDKNILITGAGRGIGKRLALGFARLGARIGLLGRNKAEIDLAHIEIEQAGCNALRLRVDVTDAEQLAVAADRMRVVFGSPVDVLICAAGAAGPLNSFLQTPLKAWTEAIHINLLGVAHSCRAVLPPMIDRRTGKILVLVCSSDESPKLNFSAYETSKTAVVRLVESLAAELIDYNIQINAFDPGPAYTNLTDEIIRAEQRLEPNVVQAAKETRRTGGVSPETQLEHAAFLVSEQSNHITGKLIHVTDDWRKLKNATLRPDAYTLRRVQR
jgi:3-oxoacyl-[acyl-carrier protein] reductase